MSRTFFITGSDTGVGKTVLTALLTRHLRSNGVRVKAVKPLCSGGRDDAEVLRAAQADELSLDEINPWHFRAPLAPLAAARKEGRTVRLAEIVRYLRASARGVDVLLVEGAGGLLSPLGEDFSSCELITAVHATPLVVVPDRLGAINQALLVMAALPVATARRTKVVLCGVGAGGGGGVHSNSELLAEKLGPGRVRRLPSLRSGELTGRVPVRVRAMLESCLSGSQT